MIKKINEDLAAVEKHSLFYGLTQEELATVVPLLKRKILPLKTTIIKEGERTTDIYLISHGEVVVQNWDETHKMQIPIVSIGPGDMFGEMSFVDSSPRSSSIQTTKPTILYQLSRKDLELNRHVLKEIYNKILTNIARITIERLRISNQRISSTLQATLGKVYSRFDNAQAALYFVLAMAFGKLLTFMNLPFFSGNQKLVNWGFWIFLLIPAIILTIYFNFTKEDLGLSPKKISKSLSECLAISLIGIGLLYFITQYLPLNPVPHYKVNLQSIVYYFTFSVIYEFLARGFFQSTLEKVFVGSNWLAPVTTSVVFTLLCLTSALLHWPTIILIFVSNLLLGFLFQRNHDLLGVILVHFALGLWLIAN